MEQVPSQRLLRLSTGEDLVLRPCRTETSGCGDAGTGASAGTNWSHGAYPPLYDHGTPRTSMTTWASSTGAQEEDCIQPIRTRSRQKTVAKKHSGEALYDAELPL